VQGCKQAIAGEGRFERRRSQKVDRQVHSLPLTPAWKTPA
jgi:hypothetical protein